MQKKIGMWNNKMQLNIKILQKKKQKKGINLKQNQKKRKNLSGTMWAETTQGLTFQHSSDKTRKKMETFQTAKKTHNYPSTKHKFF